MQEKYLTRREAAQKLGKSLSGIDYLVLSGRLKKFTRGVGKQVYFSEKQVNSLLKIKEA